MKNIKMKNIKMKNLLAENMRRFGTKNLKENIKSDPNFIEEVTVILNGALDDDLMTDNIVDELGDFYDEVYDSGDRNLIRLYDNLRSSQDTDCIQIAKAAKRLLDYLGTKNVKKEVEENMRRFGTKNLKENIKSDPNFIEEVTVILNGALDDDLMTDNIVDELGDFYDEVYDSGDRNLIRLYDNLRSSQDTDCIQIAKAAKRLLDYLGTKNV